MNAKRPSRDERRKAREQKRNRGEANEHWYGWQARG